MTPHRAAPLVGSPVRPLAAARTAARGAALGLCLAAGLAAPCAAQARHAAPAAAVRPGAARAAVPSGTAPDPRLGAEDVVTVVLSALADAGARPDAGARGYAVAFAFASPANREVVGSLESFTDLVQDEAYRPLVGHRQAARGAMHVRGDRATQRVVVTAADGERVAYTFTLARQAAGAYRGCWMTDGVVREAPSRLAAAQTA